MTMLAHLDRDLALLNPKNDTTAWTLACNRKAAYQRYKAGEIDLPLAKKLLTKGHACATCKTWNGED